MAAGPVRLAGFAAVVLLAWSGSPPGDLAAQTGAHHSGGSESERGLAVMTAAERQAAGDFAGAEAILRDVLDAEPGALAALVNLEQVLKMQGRHAEVVPFAEAFLRSDGGSGVGYLILLRTHATGTDVAALEGAGKRWIESDPGSEVPYRELADIWVQRGEIGRARATLQEGRRRIGGDALALELGMVHARDGDIEAAVSELDRAIGPEARGLVAVRRRLAALPDGGAAVLPALAGVLAGEASTSARGRAAVDLAIGAGLSGVAERAARRLVADMPEAERRQALVEIARRADGSGLRELAYWAYSELVGMEGVVERSLALRARLAGLALELGDSARARHNYEALEAAHAPGSPERRQAAALRVELTGAESGLDASLDALAAFRGEFPNAPELDRIAASVASLAIAEGRTETAGELVARVHGPESARVRGRVALMSGDLPRAKRALVEAASGLRGGAATEAIALATLLERLSEASGRLVGEAMGHLEVGRGEAGLRVLLDGVAGLPASDVPPVLDFAAGVADRAGLAVSAEETRRLLIEEHPRALDAPAALLALARSLAASEEGELEARELLERLILEHPRSALVPQARRALHALGRASDEGRRSDLPVMK